MIDLFMDRPLATISEMKPMFDKLLVDAKQ
jgi:hypothetical protein